MLEHFFQCEFVCRRLQEDPSRVALEAFAAYLWDRGHPAAVARQYINAAGHYLRWMRLRRTGDPDVNQATIERFLNRHLPRCCCAPPSPRQRILVRAALGHFLNCRNKEGGCPAKTHDKTNPPCTVIDAFDRYMQSVCGLASATRRGRRRYAREFLHQVFGTGTIHWGRLKPEHILRFVAEFARRCSPATAQVAASSLRGLLRFLQFQGHCGPALIMAVPRIPVWKRRGQGYPSTLSLRQLRGFLGSFDRSSPDGRRDYAMALCMTDLGLRVGEVVILCLEDVDWHMGTIRVASTKTRRPRVLPLPQRVGAAIAIYLRHGRPASSSRRMFLRHRAPLGRPISVDLVRAAMRHTAARGASDVQITGTHVLRHSAATLMHQGGATLKEIADVLGHRSLNTTSIYAKVNLPQLAKVARPWLGVTHGIVLNTFRQLRVRLGWAASPGGRMPRIHDLRHSFVCHTLEDWYRRGVDIDRSILSLSTYLGHRNVRDTYWYITGVPSLMALATKRFERSNGPNRGGQR